MGGPVMEYMESKMQDLIQGGIDEQAAALLPCPFCGGNQISPDAMRVICLGCGAYLGTIGLTNKTAIEMWNSRIADSKKPCPSSSIANKIAACAAHRACCGCEDDQANGKLHGYCVVCGVVWPCEVAQAFLDAVLL